APAIPGNRLLRLRHRPGRLRLPALLLHGAGRLGRQAAARVAASEDRQREMAGSGGGTERYVFGRAFLGAVGMKLLDVVALTEDLPQKGLYKGPVGTIVELL